MHKVNKTRKVNNRLRKVREDTLLKLYNNLPYQCQSCVFNANCPEIEKMDDIKDCENYERSIELNDLIEMLKSQNINLDAFCEKYNLKKEFLKQMLKGKLLMNYKYYIDILKRCHVIDEFKEYEKNFELEENEVNNF